jgi:hypothetical protein
LDDTYRPFAECDKPPGIKQLRALVPEEITSEQIQIAVATYRLQLTDPTFLAELEEWRALQPPEPAPAPATARVIVKAESNASSPAMPPDSNRPSASAEAMQIESPPQIVRHDALSSGPGFAAAASATDVTSVNTEASAHDTSASEADAMLANLD